jgi:hypothetical protein
MMQFRLTSHLDCKKEVDIIIERDGSVMCEVGHHIWLIATTEEDILMAGCGPDDGAQDQLASCRSELGRIATGLGILGTL